MAKNYTSKDVAKWMLKEVKDGPLHQMRAAEEILKRFGKQFVHINPDDDPLTIQHSVLKAFKDISSETVVYQSNIRSWRLREDHDGPDRSQ